MLPQGIEGKKNGYQEYAEEGFAVGDRHAAGKAQDKQYQCEISRIGDEIAKGGTIHSIDRNEVVVEQYGSDCQEERQKEREYIVARVTECGEANGEGGNNDLVDTEDQDYILRHSIGTAIGEDMENKVDIKPYGEEYESADEQEVVAHLVDKMRCFFAVLLFDSPCQLRRDDGSNRTVGDTDHDGDIRSDGIYAGVVKSHLCRNKERRQGGCQYTGDGGYKEEGCIEEVTAYQFGVLAEESPIGAQGYMPDSKEIGKVYKGGKCIVEAQTDDEAVHGEDTEGVEEI